MNDVQTERPDEQPADLLRQLQEMEAELANVRKILAPIDAGEKWTPLEVYFDRLGSNGPCDLWALLSMMHAGFVEGMFDAVGKEVWSERMAVIKIIAGGDFEKLIDAEIKKEFDYAFSNNPCNVVSKTLRSVRLTFNGHAVSEEGAYAKVAKIPAYFKVSPIVAVPAAKSKKDRKPQEDSIAHRIRSLDAKGKKPAEIAAALGIKVGDVNRSLRRDRKNRDK